MLSQVQQVERFTGTASRNVCSVMQNAVTGTAGRCASSTCECKNAVTGTASRIVCSKCKRLSQAQLVEWFAANAKGCQGTAGKIVDMYRCKNAVTGTAGRMVCSTCKIARDAECCHRDSW